MRKGGKGNGNQGKKEHQEAQEGKAEKASRKEEIDSMRILLWSSLIIVIIIAINELFWLGKSDLAWVILGLAVAMGLQAVYLLRKK